MEFYRYRIETSVSINDDDSSFKFSQTNLYLSTFNLHKETPKGYWIGYGYLDAGNLRGNSRWIPKVSKKRYAYPTKEEALNNLIIRTQYRVRILESQLSTCRYGIELAKNSLKSIKNEM